jgi:hypothetical protein
VSSFKLLGPTSGNNSQLFINTATAFTATASNLLFDFSGFTGGVAFQNPNLGSGQNYYVLEDQADGVGGFPGTENLRVGFADRQISARNGVVVIATASMPIPEPSTFIVWSVCGVVGSFYGYRRRLSRF